MGSTQMSKNRLRDLLYLKAWQDLLVYAQIVLCDFILVAMIILLYGALAWILKRLPITDDHRSMLEAVHFWYSFALAMLFPIKSVFRILLLRRFPDATTKCAGDELGKLP